MIMKKVYIVGNNASNRNVSDGGRIKIRLYSQLIRRNGGQVEIIDLDNWKRRIISIISCIKKAIKEKAIILVMAGPKGCRLIIPLINALNKKRARTLFCPLGVGTLDVLFSKMTPDQISSFLNFGEYGEFKDLRMAKQLRKFDVIFPQNRLIAGAYKGFYGLNNVVIIENFRDASIEKREYNKSGRLNVVYVSRVCESKGIFDLLSAIDAINKKTTKINLTIYGDLQLSKDEERLFSSYLSANIRYAGVLDQRDTIDVLKCFDLFVLPTKYHGEGTSGSLIESFIAGTPALVSSYSQAKMLIEDRKNGFIYDINSIPSLIDKLEYISNNMNCLEAVGTSAQEIAKRFLFENNKESFFKAIYGE